MLIRALLSVGVAAVCILLSHPASAQRPDLFETLRHQMVTDFIAAEGVTNPRALESMRNTPRHEFVRPSDIRAAYIDTALPIGYAQTISPPFIVAYMTETIDPQPTDKVLEIGTGSGYQAAVLSPLVSQVYSIEIVEPLAENAAVKLKKLGYANVHTKAGDGYQGWPEHAPFDKIIVTCSPERVPQPLIDQLAEGGKLLIPLGERYDQVFYLFEKKDGQLGASKLIPTLFVPMTGVSEDRREVKPDGTKPQIRNGSFEEDVDRDGRPDGWHYMRQAKLVDGKAAVGDHSILIANTNPGRLSQVLQGLALDGRSVAAVNLSAMLRSSRIGAATTGEKPGMMLLFFDQNRKAIGSGFIPVPSDGDWTPVSRRFSVPINAREAILAVTLGGGTGELSVDDVLLTPMSR